MSVIYSYITALHLGRMGGKKDFINTARSHCKLGAAVVRMQKSIFTVYY